MYRSGWGTKLNQEVTLAVRLRRDFFDSFLASAVPSTFDCDHYPDETAWKKALARSNVRLQWDPDHRPKGAPLARRAIQLGLRGPVLEEYGRRAILEIQDISAFVAEQREHLGISGYPALVTPAEHVYLPENPEVIQRLKLASR